MCKILMKFHYKEGHADLYDNLQVTIKPGHPPTLYLKEDTGEPIEEIDLSPVS